MGRKKTPSFVTEFALSVDSQSSSELEARFNAGLRLYNACLNEAMLRVDLVRNCIPYQQAKQIKPTTDELKKQRNELFSAARKQNRYSDFELQVYAGIVARDSKWIAGKLDSHTIQKLGTRAFKASEKVLFGRAKSVRFKGATRFRSMEGKNNTQGIMFKGGTDCKIVWCGLELPIIYPEKWNDVLEHGYRCPVKYCRIIWRILNGKKRWYVQFINEGEAYKYRSNTQSKTGLVGIDLNVSNVAVVGDNKAGLYPFAENVPTFEREIKSLQQKMQRSQRVNNPNNYEPDFDAKVGRRIKRKKGKVKKGSRRWKQSNAYKKYARKKRELERRKAAYSKSQNRRLANRIIREFGNNIKTEKVSVRGWQKRYGKAIAAKSPGFFQSELARKAESAGGKFTTFSTNKTALSQTHLDGTRIKKTLSERVHHDVSGFEMQRDLFSSFLARHVNDYDELQVSEAQVAWERAELLLTQAWREYKTREQVSASESRSSHSPSERVCVEGKQPNQIAFPGKKLGVSG